jgi:hypothetical protein
LDRDEDGKARKPRANPDGGKISATANLNQNGCGAEADQYNPLGPVCITPQQLSVAQCELPNTAFRNIAAKIKRPSTPHGRGQMRG